MKPKNLLYAQSGGVTSVINTTAAGVIETARASNAIGKVFAGKNGISGILKEELIDTSHESDTQIKNLKYTPGGAFGSCRYKLKDPKTNPNEYLRLLEIFKAYNIGYFLYNGGGDSQDTTNKIANFTQKSGFTVQCIGIPKTVDNDLPHTDNCPGFGSVAKYTAISTREAALDVKSMSDTSTKVFIMEVMGRHAGWIAASSSLASEDNDGPPHIILFPEKKLLQNKFLKKVKHTVLKEGYCVIVVSEGLRDFKGKFLSDSGKIDAFGHKQLGGVAPRIAEMVQTKLGYKCHWSVPDYLQRSARHLSSQVDFDQAFAVGKAAVEFCLNGDSSVMPVIVRRKTKKYTWKIGKVKLSKVANIEKKLPSSYITKEGFNVTRKFRNYLEPLILGEAPLTFKDGLPIKANLKNKLVKKRLKIN
tara:strand:- start:1547 stop:2797 length:1251 start_codon:yes stop_codon:yes gene_type:complete